MSGSATSSTVQLGAYVGNPNNSDASEEAATNAQFNSLAAAMGQTPTLMDTYIDQSIPQSQWASYAQWDAASWAAESWSAPGNLTPVIGLPMADSTQTGDAAFKSIISGQYDSAILGVFQAWAAAGYTSFYIRPGWEMNGTWYNWSVNASDAADYVAAFQHIATLAHDFSGATIKVVWNPNVGSTPVPLSSLYPGNASVDVVGLDTYGAPVDSGDPPGNTSTSSSTITLLDVLALAKANNKPFALPETGGLDANFAQQLGSVVAQSGVQVAFVNLWDIDDTSGNLSFSNASDNESAVAAAWKQAFATISAANGTSGTPGTSGTGSTTGTTTPHAASSNGATITSSSNPPLYDAAGNAFTLLASGQYAINGVAEATSSGVVELVAYGGAILQLNSQGDWWTAPSGGGAGVLTTAPPSVTIAIAEPATAAVLTGSASTIAGVQLTDTDLPASTQITLTVSDTAGTLSMKNAAGTALTGSGTGTITISDTLANLNTDLGTLTYTAGASAGTATVNVTASAGTVSGTGKTAVTISAPTAPPHAASPNGATITSPTNPPLYDAAGNAFTLLASGQYAINGKAEATSSGVVELEAYGGAILQLNSQGDWWTAPSNGGAGVLTTAPPSTTIAIAEPATAAVLTGSASTISGVQLTDTNLAASTQITLTVSDTAGTLSMKNAAGTACTGSGTKTITISDTLANLNTDLSTLTYTVGASASTDTVTVAASAGTVSGTGKTAVTITAPTAPPHAASPNGATITSPTAAPLYDAAGNAFTLLASGQYAINGKAEATSSGVVELEAYGGAILQLNSQGQWWTAPSGGGAGVLTTAPPSGTTPPTPQTMTVSTGQTATVPAGTYTVNLSGTAETVTAGSGADTFVLNNTSPATVTINKFVVGTDKITDANGLHDFNQTASGLQMWFNDGTNVMLAGVQGATAVQVMGSTTNPPITVWGGQNVTTQPGMTDTVTMVGSATLTTNGNDTVTAGAGTDTIKVNAGNIVVNGNAGGTLTFTDSSTGTATLKLAGGTTTATLGAGASTVNIAGTTTITCGTGADLMNLIKGEPIGSDVIHNFVVGTDHFHLSGYGSGTTGVSSITNGSAGTVFKLTDGTNVNLVGVHTTSLSQLFV